MCEGFGLDLGERKGSLVKRLLFIVVLFLVRVTK